MRARSAIAHPHGSTSVAHGHRRGQSDDVDVLVEVFAVDVVDDDDVEDESLEGELVDEVSDVVVDEVVVLDDEPDDPDDDRASFL